MKLGEEIICCFQKQNCFGESWRFKHITWLLLFEESNHFPTGADLPHLETIQESIWWVFNGDLRAEALATIWIANGWHTVLSKFIRPLLIKMRKQILEKKNVRIYLLSKQQTEFTFFFTKIWAGWPSPRSQKLIQRNIQPLRLFFSLQIRK